LVLAYRKTWLLVLCAGGCTAAIPPAAATTQAPTPAGYADAVVAYSRKSGTVACAQPLPACAAAIPACDADALLGTPDGETYALGNLDSIDIAFRCHFIIDQPGDGPAFQIWSTVPTGANATVAVSSDGSRFYFVDTLNTSNQQFRLGALSSSLTDASFVLVTNTGAGKASILIDAVQAL
jgi:hypothetical protein